MHVNYEQMGLAQAVLARQADEHFPAMKKHLDTWAKLSDDDLGLILQVLKPVNDALVSGGDMVLDAVKDIYSKGADNLSKSIDIYADTDLQAHALLSSHASTMGYAIPAAEDPRSSLPTLGDAGYGNPEIKNVQSNLSAPSLTTSDAESLRWEAGEILGSLDWVCEKLFGFSVLDEVVFKPFAGDWKRVEGASKAWENIGKAFTDLAENTLGVLLRITDWVSKSAINFAAAIGVVAGIDKLISMAAGLVAKGVKEFSDLVKELAKKIAHMLRRISHKLERIAAEASIPIAGWIVGAVDVVTLAKDVLGDIKWAMDAIKKVCTFISKIRLTIQKIHDAYDKAQKTIQKIQENYDKVQKTVQKVQENYKKVEKTVQKARDIYDKSGETLRNLEDKGKEAKDIASSLKRGVDARS